MIVFGFPVRFINIPVSYSPWDNELNIQYCQARCICGCSRVTWLTSHHSPEETKFQLVDSIAYYLSIYKPTKRMIKPSEGKESRADMY